MDTEEGNENEKIISKTDWRKAHCSRAFSHNPLELIEDIDKRGRERTVRTVRCSIPLLSHIIPFSLPAAIFQEMQWKWLSFRGYEAPCLQMKQNAVWLAINSSFRAGITVRLVWITETSYWKQSVSSLSFSLKTKQKNLVQKHISTALHILPKKSNLSFLFCFTEKYYHYIK